MRESLAQDKVQGPAPWGVQQAVAVGLFDTFGDHRDDSACAVSKAWG